MSTPCQWRRPHFPSKCTGTIAIIMTLRSYGYEKFSLNYLPLADRVNLRRHVGNGAEFRDTRLCWRSWSGCEAQDFSTSASALVSESSCIPKNTYRRTFRQRLV